MSVIIIGGGKAAQQAIDKLVTASHMSELTPEQIKVIQYHIDALTAFGDMFSKFMKESA